MENSHKLVDRKRIDMNPIKIWNLFDKRTCVQYREVHRIDFCM